jgi:HEPN domain-containing protein
VGGCGLTANIIKVFKTNYYEGMKEDARVWMEEAEDNLVTAKLLYESERFKDASFYAQQVAEKALKSAQIEKLNRFDRTHDLVRLAQSVKAPAEIVNYCADLTEYYVDTRYPVTKSVSEDEATDVLEKCEGVLEWVKSTPS